jgi:hypothetical protein
MSRGIWETATDELYYRGENEGSDRDEQDSTD